MTFWNQSLNYVVRMLIAFYRPNSRRCGWCWLAATDWPDYQICWGVLSFLALKSVVVVARRHSKQHFSLSSPRFKTDQVDISLVSHPGRSLSFQHFPLEGGFHDDVQTRWYMLNINGSLACIMFDGVESMAVQGLRLPDGFVWIPGSGRRASPEDLGFLDNGGKIKAGKSDKCGTASSPPAQHIDAVISPKALCVCSFICPRETGEISTFCKWWWLPRLAVFPASRLIDDDDYEDQRSD